MSLPGEGHFSNASISTIKMKRTLEGAYIKIEQYRDTVNKAQRENN